VCRFRVVGVGVWCEGQQLRLCDEIYHPVNLKRGQDGPIFTLGTTYFFGKKRFQANKAFVLHTRGTLCTMAQHLIAPENLVIGWQAVLFTFTVLLTATNIIWSILSYRRLCAFHGPLWASLSQTWLAQDFYCWIISCFS
jgi:hypothetical protein